jgi:hypothetical protein
MLAFVIYRHRGIESALEYPRNTCKSWLVFPTNASHTLFKLCPAAPEANKDGAALLIWPVGTLEVVPLNQHTFKLSVESMNATMLGYTDSS